MEIRNDRRFQIIENLKGGISINDVKVEMELAGPVGGRIVDISSSGLGFRVENADPALFKLEADKTLFVKIIIMDEVLLVEAKLAWFSGKKAGDTLIINGGLRFEILSNEDRMKLSKIIENIRKNQIF